MKVADTSTDMNVLMVEEQIITKSESLLINTVDFNNSKEQSDVLENISQSSLFKNSSISSKYQNRSISIKQNPIEIDNQQNSSQLALDSSS